MGSIVHAVINYEHEHSVPAASHTSAQPTPPSTESGPAIIKPTANIIIAFAEMPLADTGMYAKQARPAHTHMANVTCMRFPPGETTRADDRIVEVLIGVYTKSKCAMWQRDTRFWHDHPGQLAAALCAHELTKTRSVCHHE